MNVDGPVWKRLQESFGEYSSICDNGRYISVERRELRESLGRSDLCGLMER